MATVSAPPFNTTAGFLVRFVEPLLGGGKVEVEAPLSSHDREEMLADAGRIERDILDPDGGVHRFASDTFYGGGAWPVLTSAYGRVLLRRGEPGDLARATAALQWIEAQADEHGHLPEQVSDHALAPERK